MGAGGGTGGGDVEHLEVGFDDARDPPRQAGQQRPAEQRLQRDGGDGGDGAAASVGSEGRHRRENARGDGWFGARPPAPNAKGADRRRPAPLTYGFTAAYGISTVSTTWITPFDW